MTPSPIDDAAQYLCRSAHIRIPQAFIAPGFLFFGLCLPSSLE